MEESEPVDAAPFHVGPFLWCPQCRVGVVFDLTAASRSFFLGEPVLCPRCQRPIDLWSAVVGQIRDNAMLTFAYAIIGARTTAHSFELSPNEFLTLRLTDWGVPEQAVLLSINYTPIGSIPVCWPTEVHGNRPRWGPPKPAQEILIFGRDPSQAASRTKIGCSIIWFLPPDEDDGWLHLLEAFQTYGDGQLQRALIPAHIAAESALSKAIHLGLKTAAVPGLSESGRMGFANQMRLLLPLVADRYKFPRLPSAVEGSLERLRKLRNQVVHEGVSKEPLNPVTLSELLAAATFGFHYGRALRAEVNQTDA